MNALPGNSSVNTVNVQHGRCVSVDKCYYTLLRNSAPKSRDLFSVWSALCNNRTVFSVGGLCRVLIREVN
jgi:hypothetical protein